MSSAAAVLGQSWTNSKLQTQVCARGSEEMADLVRWFLTFAVHEPNGRIGTLASNGGLDPESIASILRAGMLGEEFIVS